MAVWNQVNIAYLQQFNRTDAEFFKPEYEFAFHKLLLCNAERLARHAVITDGIHASPVIFADGIRYISAKCVKDNEFYLDNCICISPLQHERNPRTQLVEGDVIITTVGTIGNVAVVENELIPTNCDRHVGIIRVKDRTNLSPYYLSTFLNSKYGRFQSLREAAGNVQLNLYIRNIGHLIIPRFGNAETEIAHLTEMAYQQRKSSKALYALAEQTLNTELGLDKLTFQKPVGYAAQFSDLETSHRADAQHYQPRFRQLIDHLSAFQTVRVRDILTYNRRGIQPIYVQNGELDVVNSQHLEPKHIDYEGLQKISIASFAAASEAHIQRGDLLIYTTGVYIGRTNAYLSDIPAMASNHVIPKTVVV